MSSIALNSDASTLQQLKTINLLAQSAKLCTSGNIGLINGRVVKFNTHKDERRNLQVTEGMRAACDSLRDALKGLVADALKGQDAAIQKICAKIDGGAGKPLLERSVVAKVIRDVEGRLEEAESLQNTDKDLAAYSSTDKDTTFVVQRRAALNTQACELAGRFEDEEARLQPKERREMLLQYIDCCTSLVGDTFVSSDEARLRFDEMVDEYTQTLKAFPQDYGFERADVVGARTALGVFARIANGGASLSLSKSDMDIKLLRDVFNVVNNDAATARTRLGAGQARLVAQLSALLDQDHVAICLMASDRLVKSLQGESRSPTRAELYRHIIGEDMPQNGLNASTSEFSTLIEDGLTRKIGDCLTKRYRVEPQGAQRQLDIQLVKAAMTGASGVVCDMETAVQLRIPENGVSITKANLTSTASLYDVVLARNQGLEGLIAQLKLDLPRNHSVCHIGDRTFDCRSLSETDTAAVAAVAQDVVDALKAMFGDDLDQLLVAGFGLTQAGLAFLQVCPMNFGGRNDHVPMEFTLARDPETGVASCTIHDLPFQAGPRVKLSYSYDIRRNGESALTNVDYHVPPQEKRADKAPVRVVKDWKKGVPNLEKGGILRQSGGVNTCFACSVLNGIAQSDALRAHFESLIDRTANPPTITLCTKKGRRMTFSLDETFGLDEKMVTRINKNLNATDFERFFMRYLATVDPLYTPGQPGNDYEVATALGLVSRGVKSMSQNEITWPQLVDHVKNGGFATLNLNMAHFQTVVAADEDGCEILDSLGGRSYLSKEEAVKGWGSPRANVCLTLYGTVPPARIDQFQRGVQGVTFQDALAGIQAKIDGTVADRDKRLAQLRLDGKIPDMKAIAEQRKQRTAWYEQNKDAVVKIMELDNKIGPKWLKVREAMKTIGEEAFKRVKADFFARETGDVAYRSIFSNTFPADESQIHAYCVAGLSGYIAERVMSAQRA